MADYVQKHYGSARKRKRGEISNADLNSRAN